MRDAGEYEVVHWALRMAEGFCELARGKFVGLGSENGGKRGRWEEFGGALIVWSVDVASGFDDESEFGSDVWMVSERGPFVGVYWRRTRRSFSSKMNFSTHLVGSLAWDCWFSSLS